MVDLQDSIKKSSNELLVALQRLLIGYLEEKPTRNLSAFSKKCKVSEPTLRRILKGQIKTLPTTTTILDILTTLTGEKSPSVLIKLFPGPLAEYLTATLPQTSDVEAHYDALLNDELADAVKYTIYKLASNSSGVHLNKIESLFGSHGLTQTEHLLEKKYLFKSNEAVFASAKHFISNGESFIRNFKIIAEYIKTENPLTHSSLHSLLANYSESVSPTAYKDIIHIQQKALKKIRDIMSGENYKGTIPVFLLLAIDTLDTKSAHDLLHEKSQYTV